MRNRFLLVILGLTLILRIPSWYEPHWYGDEEIYLTIGQALNRGVMLYSQIHDNKPPLIYGLAALAGGELARFKIILTIWNLVTIIAFWGLANKVFAGKITAVSGATVIFSLITTLPKYEGNIANAEMFFLLPTLTGVWLLWDKSPTIKRMILAGGIFGTAALFKLPAILEAAVWPPVWWIFERKDWLKKCLFFGFGVISPILITIFIFGWAGAASEYIKAVWWQNFSYARSWEGDNSIITRGVILAAGTILILLAGKKIGRIPVIISLWGLWVWFAVLLSGRPYPHYLLQAAGVIALAVPALVQGKKPVKAAAAGVIILVMASVPIFHFYSYQTVNYYKNFLEWRKGQKNTSEYFSWFGSQINDNYAAAVKINTLTQEGDKIFVWGDEPAIYVMTRRQPVGVFTVRYHIKELKKEKETMEKLISEKPKVVVIIGDNMSDLPGLLELIEMDYSLQGTWGARKVFLLQI